MFWITESSLRKSGRGLSNQSVRRVGRRLLKINRIGRPDGVQGGFQNRSSCGLISASNTFSAIPRKDFGLPGVFSNQEPSTEIGFNAKSLMSSKEFLLTVRQEHCLAIENGVHYRGGCELRGRPVPGEEPPGGVWYATAHPWYLNPPRPLVHYSLPRTR